MAKAKTPKAPKEEKQTKVEDIDLDAELKSIKTVHGTGIQAYMRQKIAEATERK